MTIKSNEKQPEDEEQEDTWRMYKNVIVVGIAFMIQFTSYQGTADLQSSINADAGLGTASLAAVYSGLIISSIFLPAAVIKLLGTKWTMCLSSILYMPYIVVQLWPTFYSMIPAAFISGLGAGPLWCAMCIYVAVISETYSRKYKISTDVLLPRFMGIFFTFNHLSVVWGNLISSLVIRSGGNKAALTLVNASDIPELCGANFLPSVDSSKALQHQPPEKIQMLVVIFLVCNFVACLIVAFGLDSMTRYDKGKSNTQSLSGLALLSVTVKLLSEPDQLLLIIISMFIGVQNVFFSAGISAAYVSCIIGTGTVGFVMMAHGVTDVIGSAFTASVAKIIPRVVLLTCTTMIFFALSIFLLVWKPHEKSEVILFSVALLWGLCSSTFLVQINAYHGILFPNKKDAAFTNFRMWKAIGYVIAYITSHHMRTSAKIYFNIAMLIVGYVCYLATEYRQKVRKRLEKKEVEGVVNIGFKYVE